MTYGNEVLDLAADSPVVRITGVDLMDADGLAIPHSRMMEPTNNMLVGTAAQFPPAARLLSDNGLSEDWARSSRAENLTLTPGPSRRVLNLVVGVRLDKPVGQASGIKVSYEQDSAARSTTTKTTVRLVVDASQC